MKRRDLLRELTRLAASQGQELVVTEGARHTKVRIGVRWDMVPRHREISEMTAKAIIRQLGGGQ
ncbi:MAG: hypothetical protein LBL01_05720 [Bifidobacteriaceae bacterium]|jgi:mRNA interferase HicA|nr:hypothetical protein [Bifidobacteriaceae bacterium]